GAGGAIESYDAAALGWAIQDYYDVARAVSRRLIAGETGENLVEQMAQMQERQRKARELIRKTTGLDQNELAAGFAMVRDANLSAFQFRMAIGVFVLVVVLGLSWRVSRGMLRALAHLSSGFARFATGDFSQKIPVTAGDELGDVAKEANMMAANL